MLAFLSIHLIIFGLVCVSHFMGLLGHLRLHDNLR
ncbi:unnamed protein product [Schistocephalus solidus]|uniref:Uncharacterized protein n=1 Tax=Schistocephalus solidus TaxID=70667 RepID=A0A183SDF0_SCHSO|nr:unnamed protein product [Schistocephalus solidus]